MLRCEATSEQLARNRRLGPNAVFPGLDSPSCCSENRGPIQVARRSRLAGRPRRWRRGGRAMEATASVDMCLLGGQASPSEVAQRLCHHTAGSRQALKLRTAIAGRERGRPITTAALNLRPPPGPCPACTLSWPRACTPTSSSPRSTRTTRRRLEAKLPIQSISRIRLLFLMPQIQFGLQLATTACHPWIPLISPRIPSDRWRLWHLILLFHPLHYICCRTPSPSTRFIIPCCSDLPEISDWYTTTVVWRPPPVLSLPYEDACWDRFNTPALHSHPSTPPIPTCLADTRPSGASAIRRSLIEHFQCSALAGFCAVCPILAAYHIHPCFTSPSCWGLLQPRPRTLGLLRTHIAWRVRGANHTPCLNQRVWRGQGEGRLARVTPNRGKGVRRAKEDTSAATRYFPNGTLPQRFAECKMMDLTSSIAGIVRGTIAVAIIWTTHPQQKSLRV